MTDEHKSPDDTSDTTSGSSGQSDSGDGNQAAEGDRQPEEPGGEPKADAAGTSSGEDSGDSGDKGVSNAGGVNDHAERTSTGTAASSVGSDTGSKGYKAPRTDGNEGSGQPLGPDRRAQATKVSPTEQSEEYRSVATGEEQQQANIEHPRFRGPRPFRRWKQRAYTRAKESAKRT